MEDDLMLDNKGSMMSAVDGITRNSGPAANYNALFTKPMEFTGQYGQGNSMFDDNVPFNQLRNLGEIRAQRQPWIAKAGAGLGRVGSKALTEIAKMPGVLGGMLAGGIGQIGDAITGEDNTDFMQTAFNNPWIQSLNDANEHINSELLPVYVKKAVQDGNLWDNITSVDFWATEGADGIGYILSMLAPGAAINRFNLGAKALGIGKLAKMADKMDEAVNVLGKIKLTPNNANLATGTIANTIFEAGAEAQGAMESFKAELDIKLQNGEINQSEYDNEMLRQSEVGANVFAANAVILLGPNALMSNMLWGKARNKGLNLISKKGAAGFEEVAKKTLTQKIGQEAKTGVLGALSEGFWEEGMQSTAEQYFTEEKGGLLDFVGDLPMSYADMISETDGQKAIFLGAAFGGGMTMYHDYKQKKNEVAATNKIVGLANQALSDFYTIYKGDNFKENPEDQDLDTMVKKLRALQGAGTLGDIYDMAVETGNTAVIETLRNVATVNLVKPFIVNDSLGIDALKEHLKDSTEMLELSETEWKGNTEGFIKHIVDTATELQKVYNNYNDFAPTVLDLKNENATQKDKNEFYNDLADDYVNAKSTQLFLKNEFDKQHKSKNELLAEKGRTLNDVEENKMIHKELMSSDLRYKKLDESIVSITKQLREATKEVDKLWNEENINKVFDNTIKNKQRIIEENAKEAEVQSVIDKVKAAKTDKEVDDITIPDTVAKEAIQDAKKKRKEEIQVQKDIKDKDTKSKNEDFDQSKKVKDLQAEEALIYVKDNYNVGENITLEPELGLAEEHNGKTATIKSIDKNGVVLTLEDGTDITASIEATKKVVYDNNANYSSEGGENDVVQIPNEDVDAGVQLQKRGDSRIMASDNINGDALFGNEAAKEFEQVPRDKVGEEKGFEIGKEGFTDNQKKALKMYNDKDFSNIDFLIDHLPISVTLSEGVTAPLATKSDKSAEYNKNNFDESTRHIRETIIKEIANNNVAISDITAPIVGQSNGQLQIAAKENGLVVENPISGLYEFMGDMSKIKSTDFYMVDDFGFLKNSEGETFPTAKNKSNAKGEIYLLINMANGKKFPLKLNVSKISDTQASTLFEIYKFIAEDSINLRDTRIEDLENKELVTTIKEVFAKEIELFSKNKKSIKRLTVGDILDTMIFSSTNPKSQLRFSDKGLHVAEKLYSIDDLNKPETKAEFISIVSTSKRQQIKFKKSKAAGVNDFHFENRSYIEYLLSNGILNTNAVIGKPTFSGKTNMFLDTKGVKVKGVESQFNKDVPVYMSETLLGTTKQLEKALPGLFKNPVHLNKEGTHYVNSKGNKHKRVSTLKEGKVDNDAINIYNGGKRGDVVDEVIRQFFSNPYFKKSEFLKQGKKQVENINKVKPESTIIIEDKFFDQLFNILETYKMEFDKRNWTVYSNSPSLSGVIDGEAYAGTGDLLVYDNTKKSWMFIDIKTSSKSRSEYYEGKDPYNYKGKDAIQQNAYRELFKQLTGVEVSNLLILPLTTTSADPGVNSEYTDISIGLTKADKKLLIVDMSKDIFELLGKKRTTSKKVELTDTKTPNDINDDLRNTFIEDGTEPFNLDEYYGIETKPSEKPVPQPVKKVQSVGTLADADLQVLMKMSQTRGDHWLIDFNGKKYMMTSNPFYFHNITDKTPVTDMKLINQLLLHHNSTSIQKVDADFVKETIKKTWLSRINVVPLQKPATKTVQPTTKTTKVVTEEAPKVVVKPVTVKKTDTLDFNKLTKEEAEGIIDNLMTKFPGRLKDIGKVVSRKISPQEMVKALYSTFENNALAKEAIETKCKGK